MDAKEYRLKEYIKVLPKIYGSGAEYDNFICIDFDFDRQIESFAIYSLDEAGIKNDTIFEGHFRMLTTFNYALNEFKEAEVYDPAMKEELLIILDEIANPRCKEFTLDRYLRYTACINPDMEAFHDTSQYGRYSWHSRRGEIVEAKDIPIKERIDLMVNKQSSRAQTFEVYSLLEIIHYTLLALASNNQVVRRCGLCGKYFSPSNKSDEIYCQFPNEAYSNKSCRDASKYEVQKKREQSAGEVFKLEKNIYNRLNNRDKAKMIVSGGTSASLKQADIFLEEKNKRKKLLKSGKLDNKKYIEWLRKYDEDTKR